MISDREINLLEFYVRFGDPETQALFTAAALRPAAAAAGYRWRAGWSRRSASLDIQLREASAACVVLASDGYPRTL